MKRLLVAELRKALSTRTPYGLALGAMVVAGLTSFAVITSQPAGLLEGTLRDSPFFLLGAFNLLVFSLVLGVRVASDDLRYGTIVPTLLATPSRFRVAGAKLANAAMLGAALALAALTVLVGVAMLLLGGKGVTVSIGPADVGAVGTLVLAAAAFSAIGVGIGNLIRHQVAALAGVLVWMLVVENLGTAAYGAGARLLPGQAAHSIISAAPETLPATGGALVLLAYVGVAAALGTIAFVRRDVVTA